MPISDDRMFHSYLPLSNIKCDYDCRRGIARLRNPGTENPNSTENVGGNYEGDGHHHGEGDVRRSNPTAETIGLP
jgi:hypothetical protein